MPFIVVRNDITRMQVDAIVNTANPKPVIGQGVDSAIHEKAGAKLLQARQKLGAIDVGDAAVTPGFGLEANYVIHTVGPVWNGGDCGETALLRSCYHRSLALAKKLGCRSVAFPLISTGNYGFPKDLALGIAMEAFREFLAEWEMQIYLVVFDGASYRLSEQLFRDVESYIDEHYVASHTPQPENFRRRRRNLWEADMQISCSCAEGGEVKSITLEEMLGQEDAGFTETLLRLIDASGKKDSQIYKKANLSKQHFSKIRNDPYYQPSKSTAIALALALELDLEQTKDLIGRAGYALSNSSRFDLIIRFHIERRDFDVVKINMVLYEFDQKLLGA